MLKIVQGEVYDPINGIDGEKRDICIEDGKIVAEVEGAPTIDASGMVVMPGGVDIHSHVAGSKVNTGRKMRPEDHRGDVVPKTNVTRSGVGYTVPSTFTTGYRYAALGYTTVMEAAVPPLMAKHAHEELNDIPLVDKACFPLMGNNYFVLKYIATGEFQKVKAFVAWLLQATKGYAIKIVNPGGVDTWKWGKNIESLDEKANTFEVTPRQILTTLARVREDLGLPHPIHVHCNNLGVPGNYETTLKTMEAVEGRGIHITHAQFNSYGGESWASFRSKAPEIATYVNDHPNVTIDVGQVVFGEATTMTADGPWQYRLHQLTGHKWVNSDVEMETGAGIVPYRFSKRNPVNAIQWAIGLELLLLIEDPWRVFLTTDHPNGGPFYFYPQIIKLLMSQDARLEMLESVHKFARTRTSLKELDREYSLSEIAIITRAGTAKALGLKEKGHLGVGADADIAIYPKVESPEEMFSNPRYVIKGGKIIVEDGKVVRDGRGKTFFVEPPYDKGIEAEIREDFERYYTVTLENYPVPMEYLPQHEVIPCV